MRHRRWSTVLAAFVGLGLLVTSVAHVGASGEIALLNGKVIDASRAANLHCHDLDHPIVRCFTSDEAMLDAVTAALDDVSDTRAVSLSSLGYVVVWEHFGYSGASRALSIDYVNLGSIGWSDRITSFKSFGAIGLFREHAPSGGFTYAFAGTTQVYQLGSSYNDKFSAFYVN